jgi:hypothetical protein
MPRPTAVPRSSTSTPAPPAAPARRASDMKASVIAWEEPPLVVRGPNRTPWWGAILPELRANKGRWAKLLIFPKQSQAATRVGAYRRALQNKTAPRGYEFVARRLPDGRGAVYGRYVGKDEE